jgi:hypothetical protein
VLLNGDEAPISSQSHVPAAEDEEVGVRHCCAEVHNAAAADLQTILVEDWAAGRPWMCLDWRPTFSRILVAGRLTLYLWMCNAAYETAEKG